MADDDAGAHDFAPAPAAAGAQPAATLAAAAAGLLLAVSALLVVRVSRRPRVTPSGAVLQPPEPKQKLLPLNIDPRSDSLLWEKPPSSNTTSTLGREVV